MYLFSERDGVIKKSTTYCMLLSKRLTIDKRRRLREMQTNLYGSFGGPSFVFNTTSSGIENTHTQRCPQLLADAAAAAYSPETRAYLFPLRCVWRMVAGHPKSTCFIQGFVFWGPLMVHIAHQSERSSSIN